MQGHPGVYRLRNKIPGQRKALLETACPPSLNMLVDFCHQALSFVFVCPKTAVPSIRIFLHCGELSMHESGAFGLLFSDSNAGSQKTAVSFELANQRFNFLPLSNMSMRLGAELPRNCLTPFSTASLKLVSHLPVPVKLRSKTGLVGLKHHAVKCGSGPRQPLVNVAF